MTTSASSTPGCGPARSSSRSPLPTPRRPCRRRIPSCAWCECGRRRSRGRWRKSLPGLPIRETPRPTRCVPACRPGSPNMRRDEVLDQVDLSESLGGAEIYAAFTTRALRTLGYPARLVALAGTRIWEGLDLGGAEVVRVNGAADVARVAGGIAMVHAPLAREALDGLKRAGRGICGFAHQALYNDERPAYYEASDLLFGVSRHVIDGLRLRGLGRVYEEPLYGVADLHRPRSSVIRR